MAEFKCAFNQTLVTNQFGCEKGEQVIRRGGPDVVCISAEAHQRCENFFARLKEMALPAFGVTDDLLSMPHSVQMKIQYGGLLGLQRQLGNCADTTVEVKNIYQLIDRAIARHGNIDAIPCQAFVEDITSYKLKRRGQ
ncbi:MAG: hypothetical protein ACYC9J_10525 [Sulfuricaulis sp.]